MKRDKWIRVDDRLPETDDDVLAYDRHLGVITASWQGACKYYPKPDWNKSHGGEFFQLDDFFGDADLQITHWQELPAPPK